jgi:hypothetical protein
MANKRPLKVKPSMYPLQTSLEALELRTWAIGAEKELWRYQADKNASVATVRTFASATHQASWAIVARS